jgi:NAD(P)H-nitrite reductase large subunit
MRHDHLIVGGGIAGVTAAETIRKRDDRASIRVIGTERHPLYSRVLLPHVADGRAREERVVIRTAAELAAKGIEYAVGETAAKLDLGRRVVTLADGAERGYGKLLVASGGDARRFEGPGAEHCLYFRTLDDLHALLSARAVGRAVVYGGGFNALDLCVSLARRGARVTSVVRGDGHLARSLDPRSREAIRSALERHGVAVAPRKELRAVERTTAGYVAHLADGGREACDLVGVSIGVTPNVGWLAGSGVPVATGVVVDERLRAAEGVFAAGDVAEYFDAGAAMHRIAGNWMNAMFQGRTAGENMTGADRVFDLVTSYSIAVFDLPVAFVGATDDRLSDRVVRATDAATLQLFLHDGRVVGATCVGHFTERAALTKLMASRAALSPAARAAATDARTDLAALVP